jgi:hypothetical protein
VTALIGIVAAIAVVAIPLIAWSAVPKLNVRFGRPLEATPPPWRDPGARYLYQLRLMGVFLAPTAMFCLWLIALLTLIAQLVPAGS